MVCFFPPIHKCSANILLDENVHMKLGVNFFNSCTNNYRPRNEIKGSDSDPSSPKNHANAPDSYSGIPPNVNGKKYSMQQAFELWFDNKDTILSATSLAKAGEGYKLSKPENLYHLTLHHMRNGPDATTGFDETILEDRGAEASASVQSEVSLTQGEPALPHSVELVQPSKILWVYLDPAGNEQGPFSGDVMQEWLSQGYLSLDLKIRRREENEFRTLNEFSGLVQNYVQPFKVPLAPVANAFAPDTFSINPGSHLNSGGSHIGHNSGSFGSLNSFNQAGSNSATGQQSFGTNLYSQLLPNGGLGAANIRTPSSGLQLFDFMGTTDYLLMNQQFPTQGLFGIDSLNQNLTGDFGQLNMPSLLQHQIQSQQPLMVRTNSGWGIDTTIQPSLPASPSVISPAPLGGVNTSLGLRQQSGTMSPWMNRVQSMSRVNSPFVPSSSLAGEATLNSGDNVLQDFQNTIAKDILGNNNISVPESLSSGASLTLAREPSIVPETVRIPETTTLGQTEAETPVEPVIPKKESSPPPVASRSEQPDVSVEDKEERQTEAFEDTSISAHNETENEMPIASQESKREASQPSVAPWANTKISVKKEQPTVTLKQIQELEAVRLQKLKQMKAETKQEIALANAMAASKLEDKPQDKATFNWANSPQRVNAKKTLAEIQKEEEAELLKSKVAKASNAVPKATLAATLASIPPSTENDGPWTTVPTKKVPASKKPIQTQPSLSYSAVSGAIDPQALRGASAQPKHSSGVSSSALKEEVLVWARSAMTNLYPSVSKNDLLEIFTSLPLHQESSQLIAETIYSSSTTMDGRRFAQEFMKRREQVEKKIGSSESWSAEIVSSADNVPLVDDEGWSTSSKSKKKGRRN